MEQTRPGHLYVAPRPTAITLRVPWTAQQGPMANSRVFTRVLEGTSFRDVQCNPDAKARFARLPSLAWYVSLFMGAQLVAEDTGVLQAGVVLPSPSTAAYLYLSGDQANSLLLVARAHQVRFDVEVLRVRFREVVG